MTLDAIQADAFKVYMFVRAGGGDVLTACEAVNDMLAQRGLERVNHL